MKCVMLFSGGKDSNLALWYAIHQGWDILQLLSIVPESLNSYMFHYPNIRWVNLQAEAMGYPLQSIQIKGDKEEEIEKLEKTIGKIVKELQIDALISGAVESDYQKTRIDRICNHLGLRSISPLWKKASLDLLKEEIIMGFKIILTAYSAYGFDDRWLGRQLDLNAVDEIAHLEEKFGVNPIFEGGEAETYVIDSPLFKTAINIVSSEKKWKGDVGYMRILQAELALT